MKNKQYIWIIAILVLMSSSFAIPTAQCMLLNMSMTESAFNTSQMKVISGATPDVGSGVLTMKNNGLIRANQNFTLNNDYFVVVNITVGTFIGGWNPWDFVNISNGESTSDFLQIRWYMNTPSPSGAYYIDSTSFNDPTTWSNGNTYTLVMGNGRMEIYKNGALETNASTKSLSNNTMYSMRFGRQAVSGNPTYTQLRAWTTNTSMCGTPAVPDVNTIKFLEQNPQANTQFNTTSIYYNLTINITGTNTTTSTVTTCNLNVSNTILASIPIIGNGTQFISTTNTTTAGTKNFGWECINNFANMTPAYYTFYIDTVFPSISTTLVNNSVYYQNNITANINFTDDQALFRWNISIDNIGIANNTIGGTDISSGYYLNLNPQTLSTGSHLLKLEVWDGHTEEELKDDYQISKGLFQNKLNINSNNKDITIQEKNEDLFDRWGTTKQTDRYTFKYKPSTKPKATYTFIVSSDDPITIINRPDLEYKAWLIMGNKWVDFKVKDNKDFTIDIKQNNKNKVEVTVGNLKGATEIEFESIGELNYNTATYTFNTINASITYQTQVFEGSLTPHTLNVTLNSTANLSWNSINKPVTTTGNYHTSSFVVPTGTPNPVNFIWYFEVNGYPFNISGSQNYTSISLSNCSAGNYVVLNYSLFDEETQASAVDNISIETDISLSSIYTTSMWNFSIQSNSNLLICLPNGTLTAGNFSIDAITKYQYQAHAPEFHYIQNMSLTTANIPKQIPLYDLLSSDSTSFLIEYRDENYLAYPNLIIDTLRYYISEGVFKSVENGKTDTAGQTNAHLVTEDVIYKFNVWSGQNLVYQTPEYKALCQQVPCQITLRKEANLSTTSVDNYIISLNYDKPSRTSTLNFATKDGSTVVMNLTTYKYNAYDNETVCSSQILSSAGTLSCTIPITVLNQSYLIKVKEGYNSTTLGYRIITLGITAYERFGGTGIIMSAFSFLSLVLLGLSSGTATVVFAILGLILVVLLNFLDAGSIIGVGSTIIWVIIAGAILVWKIGKRRVQ